MCGSEAQRARVTPLGIVCIWRSKCSGNWAPASLWPSHRRRDRPFSAAPESLCWEVPKGHQKKRGFAKVHPGPEGPVESDAQQERLEAAGTPGPDEDGPRAKCCCPGRQPSGDRDVTLNRDIPQLRKHHCRQAGDCQCGRGPPKTSSCNLALHRCRTEKRMGLGPGHGAAGGSRDPMLAG